MGAVGVVTKVSYNEAQRHPWVITADFPQGTKALNLAWVDVLKLQCAECNEPIGSDDDYLCGECRNG